MEILDTFLAGYPTRRYSKGQTIVGQNKVPTSAFVIKSGFVKVFDITAEGEIRNLLFDHKLEVFPIGWVFGQLHSTKYFYEAMTQCEVYMVPRSDYITFLKQNPEIQFELFGYFVERYLSFQSRILALEQTKASDKVLFTLRFITTRFGRKENDKDISIQIPLTQQDIADFIGLTRETTSIELKKLDTEGVISSDHQHYTVHLQKLRQALEGK